MAEIVCPHCHASVPRDGAFCPRCRSFIGRAADEDHEPPVAVSATVVPDAVADTAVDASADAGTSRRSGAGRAAVAKDLFEEAVRTSMAQSATGSRVRERPDVPDEPGDEPDPYPSDTELAGRVRVPRIRRRPRRDRDTPRTPESSESPRSPRSPRTPRSPGTPDEQRPSALATVILWVVGLPARVRTVARRLGPMPVTVGVVVLALLASGGLLYSVGAFGHGTGSGRKPESHAPAVHVLTPTKVASSCASPASVDSAGNRVTFGAGHLVDGKTSTAWRCPDDGRGQRVTLTFAEPVQITQLALVPGWATKDRTSKANRFAENGAPTVITWHIGSTPVRQQIAKPRPRWAVQRLHTPVTSRTVTLAVDDVRKGNRRSTVAISEIRVYGR